MNQNVYIEGMFSIIIYKSDNNFTVAKFKINDKEEKILTVTGYIGEVLEDTLYRLYGEYKEHYRYGMQFEVASYEKILPTDHSSLIRFFSSSLFPGVGKKAATILVETLKEKAIDIIREDSNVLYQIPSLKKKQIQSIIEGIQNEFCLDDSIVFLTQQGVSLKNIMKIEAFYKEKTIEVVKNNPYQLVFDIDGIGFKTADKIGKNMGIDENDPNRIKAAIIAVLNQIIMNSGNTYICINELMNHVRRYFPFIDEDSFYDYLYDLRMIRQIYIEEEDVYPIAQYDAEKGIATFLASFPYLNQDECDENLLLEMFYELQEHFSITYEEKQLEAILNFFRHPFSIITGGPGTGKTTIVRAIIALYKQLFPTQIISVCAPTGRAAKRLSELSQVEATTIHSLLKWDLETNSFGINEDEPLDCDLLIIDEFSMVDSYLFYHLLRASYSVKKILLIGDEDQLPSVGPGFVLKDLISSNCFMVSRLSKIFRQKEGSDVVKLAYEIKNGTCDVLENSNQVKMYSCLNYEVKNHIVSIFNNAFEKGYNDTDIQVLAPMYNGVAGIDVLNNTLQEICNPKSDFKKELKVGYRIFRENDKILQLKNQPDDNVYNGDIGKIVEIEYQSESHDNKNHIIVDYDGNLVEYTDENFNVITHAYCISIHKAQGSEYPIVIMPILKDYTYMLQRRLIYTGISRAKKSLILLGDKEILKKGINRIEVNRNTKLKQRICAYFE